MDEVCPSRAAVVLMSPMRTKLTHSAIIVSQPSPHRDTKESDSHTPPQTAATAPLTHTLGSCIEAIL